MAIFENWWSRRVSRNRAITSLVLMVLAIGLHVWALAEHVYPHRFAVVLAWTVAILFTIDAVRVITGLATDRFPR